jgi:integrase
VGESTAAKAYRLLHAVLATATVDELLARNPCVVKGAGTEHAPERPVISVADVWAFADIVAPRYRTLVLMAAFLGLRRGELFGLTRSRIDCCTTR